MKNLKNDGKNGGHEVTWKSKKWRKLIENLHFWWIFWINGKDLGKCVNRKHQETMVLAPNVVSSSCSADFHWILRLEMRQQQIYSFIFIYILYLYVSIYIYMCVYIYMSGGQNYIKLLIIRNGHGQSGWCPIGCEGLCFHAMCKYGISVSGRPPIGCEGFHTSLNIPSPLPTTFVFR